MPCRQLMHIQALAHSYRCRNRQKIDCIPDQQGSACHCCSGAGKLQEIVCEPSTHMAENEQSTEHDQDQCAAGHPDQEITAGLLTD